MSEASTLWATMLQKLGALIRDLFKGVTSKGFKIIITCMITTIALSVVTTFVALRYYAKNHLDLDITGGRVVFADGTNRNFAIWKSL